MSCSASKTVTRSYSASPESAPPSRVTNATRSATSVVAAYARASAIEDSSTSIPSTAAIG
jgi:hypothetical protein